MSEVIIKLGRRYHMLDVTTDKPTTRGLTCKGVAEHVEKKEGKIALQALPARLARADARGSSCCYHTLQDVARIWAIIRSRPPLDNAEPKKPAAKTTQAPAQAAQRLEA